MLHQLMLKVSVKLSRSPLFTQTVEQQKKYIDKFNEPKTLVRRSFYQYKAQMKCRSFLAKMLYNLAALPMIFVFLLHIRLRSKTEERYDAVYDLDGSGMENVIPNSLRREFESIKSTKNEKGFLTISDKLYILKLIFRYPLSWFFLFKVILKIRRIRNFISLYDPKAIIVCNEFSFSSSCLTDFCNRNGVELINVMHGEKLFNIRDSFFKFNRCYIWNECYKDLFTELRAAPDQFIVEVPPSLLFDKKDVNKCIDYTYYLQAQQGEKLSIVVNNLRKLHKEGCKVAIRPHPRYTKLDELMACLGDIEIEVEKCRELSIETSILRTQNVISVYSTVLQQAYYNGTNVVIDDLSDPDMIEKLRELRYVMFKMENQLLSDIVAEI